MLYNNMQHNMNDHAEKNGKLSAYKYHALMRLMFYFGVKTMNCWRDRGKLEILSVKDFGSMSLWLLIKNTHNSNLTTNKPGISSIDMVL